jgi:hypothetical protein
MWQDRRAMKNPLRDVQATLAEHAAAIQQLQNDVAGLTEVLARVDATAAQARLDAAQLPVQLRAAVDDLANRIGALSRRADAEGRS